MRVVRLLVTFTAAFACAVAVTPLGAADAADQPAAPANADCAGIMFATAEDVNTVVVRVVDPGGPFTGTITAYGARRVSTGQIGRAALVELPYGGHEASVIVRADVPIEGIEYTPTWAACTFHALPFPRGYIEERSLARPTLLLGSSQPAAPVSCAQPYVSPAVTQAVEPQTPEGGVTGTVRIAVALDARGSVRGARVLTSPAAVLNGSAVASATRSQYTGAIFRCVAVPSAYPFGVDYSA
jgi:hypothetical protein